MLAGSAHHQLGRELLHTEGPWQVVWLPGDEASQDSVSSMGVILTFPPQLY